MIQILYTHWDQLPTKDILLSKLPNAWKETAIARYGKRAQNAARAGLAGLWLLYSAGVTSGELKYSENGRPYLTEGFVDFNFSHTEKLTVCVVSTSQNASAEELFVGIDAESGERITADRFEQIAKRWFTPEEWRLLSGARDANTFLRIWTGKEALVKRSGKGLKDLRDANTVSLDENLQLRSFWIGNTITTVCAHRDADVGKPVCMDGVLLKLLEV